MMTTSIPASSPSLSPHSRHPTKVKSACYSPMQTPRASLSPSPQKPLPGPSNPALPSAQRRRQQQEQQDHSLPSLRQPLKDATMLSNQQPHQRTGGATARQRSGGQTGRKVSGYAASGAESAAWTRRTRQQTEHSSADEEEEVAPPLESPNSDNGSEVTENPLDAPREASVSRQQTRAAQMTSSVPQKRTSQTGSASASTSGGPESKTALHSAARPRLSMHPAAHSSKGPSTAADDDLEDHFAQVSMTPPVTLAKTAAADLRFGAVTSRTAAEDDHAAPYPSSMNKMTRTSAFGPFSPLSDQSEKPREQEQPEASEGGFGTGLKRTFRLHGSSLAPPPLRVTRKHESINEGDSESSETSADERSFEGQSPSVHAAKQRHGQRHVRSKTIESTQDVSSVAQRRGRTPTFLSASRRPGEAEVPNRMGTPSMELDSDTDIGAPPSPTPMGSSDGSLGSHLKADFSMPMAASNGFLQPGPLSWKVALQRRGSAGGSEPIQRGSKTSSSSPGLSASSSAGQPLSRQDASPAVMITRPSRHGASLSTSSASSSSSHSFNLPSMKLGKSTISSSSSPHKAKRRLTAADKGTRMRASVSHEEQLDGNSQAVNQSFRFPSESSSPGGIPREPHTSGRRSSTSHRGGRMDRLIAARALTSSDASGTPSKAGNSLHDDSGLGLSFTSTEDQADTPFRPGGKFLTAGFDDTPEKGLLGGNMGGTGSLVFGNSPARTRKSTSCDSLSGTPARPKPASMNHRGPFNPFGPIQRSSLANQATFTPGGVESGPSSPDCGASQRTISVPEGLASMEAGEPYSTPQNFKNIKPLQTAFMSTGLVSKRTRGVATADGELLPLPPRPNFGANVAVAAASAATSTMPPPSMAAAMGLKEVVAAAVRRASLGGMTVGAGGQQGPSVMPDTPMKKLPAGGLAQQFKGGAVGGSSSIAGPANRQPPPSVLRPTASSRPFFGNFSMAPPPSSLSASSSLTVPSLSPGRDSVSSGGESPVLGDTCDSPTMNLVSVSGSGSDLKSGQDWPRFSSLPRQDEDYSPDFVPTPSLSISPSTKVFVTSLPAGPSDNNYLSVSKNTAQAPALVSSRHPMRRTRTNAILPASTTLHSKADASNTVGKPGDRPAIARSFSEQVGGPRPRSRLGMLQGSDVSEGEEANGGGSLSVRPPFSRNRSRPGLGLQRKASFGVGGDGTFPMNTPTTGLFPIPSTPTRAGGPIKWFEAARLGTTPSPPRRQAKDSQRYTAGGSKSKGRSGTSGLPKDTSLVATPTASKHSGIGRFQAHFTQLAVLGSGEFSEAVKVEDKSSGEVTAVKRMKRRFVGPRDRLRHLEEVDILRHLGGHANVISLVDAWEEDSHLFIQTELCPLGTLSFFLEGYGYLVGTLDEPRLWKVLAELSSGLQHIHSHGVLHLDLKPANIFVTEIGSLKIGDFGLASRWPTVEPAVILSGAQVGPTDPIAAGLPPPAASSATNSLDPNATRKARRGSKACNLEREGDREYLAPEIISQAQYSKAADIFSLGLIMVEAVGNVVMPDNGEPWQKLRNDDLSDVDFSMISVSLFRLIRSMLSSHPHKRPSVEEILQHPVLAAVQEKMREGLRASELDQLPDFDLPRTRSGLSTIHSSSSLGSAIDALEEASGDGNGGNDLADRSSSSIAAQVAPDTPALSIRGALIQEDDLFLCTVLAHDPDPEAREFAANEWTGDSSGEMLENWQEDEGHGEAHGHGHGGRYGYGIMGGAGTGADDSAVLGLHFADETLAEEDEGEYDEHYGSRRGREEDFSMDLDEDEDADAFS